MHKKTRTRFLLSLVVVVLAFVLAPQGTFAAGATTELRVVKFAEDGSTVLAEKSVDYKWMEQNLPVQGDGETHYYHQGPVFEGDSWDPDRTQNLKDKGAVKGTSAKDLCGLVGGMAEGDELMFVAVDGWHTKFGYTNIYEPEPEQGIMSVCWFCGRDAEEGERVGTGYPANNAYSSALQMVFMSKIPNAEGKFVFGNNDMRIALPQQEYQYFFEGQFPSTNGLSGKWISELRVYAGGVPEDVQIGASEARGPSSSSRATPLLPIALGGLGVVLVGWYFLNRGKTE